MASKVKSIFRKHRRAHASTPCLLNSRKESTDFIFIRQAILGAKGVRGRATIFIKALHNPMAGRLRPKLRVIQEIWAI
jgi:hypothetical protein